MEPIFCTTEFQNNGDSHVLIYDALPWLFKPSFLSILLLQPHPISRSSLLLAQFTPLIPCTPSLNTLPLSYRPPSSPKHRHGCLNTSLVFSSVQPLLLQEGKCHNRITHLQSIEHYHMSLKQTLLILCIGFPEGHFPTFSPLSVSTSKPEKQLLQYHPLPYPLPNRRDAHMTQFYSEFKKPCRNILREGSVYPGKIKRSGGSMCPSPFSLP